jgi:hypothetical protein
VSTFTVLTMLLTSILNRSIILITKERPLLRLIPQPRLDHASQDQSSKLESRPQMPLLTPTKGQHLLFLLPQAARRKGNNPGIEHAVGHPRATTQSRIPRMSVSKGSSARAPTLSSTLKQTKSTQTLRSPKATKGKVEQKVATASKAAGMRSLRHVRTVDSTGSTPILSNRKSRDLRIPASVASTSMRNTQRMTCASDMDLLASYLQDTALEAAGPPEDPEDLPLPPSRTASRATSSCTVKASQITRDLARPDSAIMLRPEISELSGMFDHLYGIVASTSAHERVRQHSLQ